MQIRRFHSVARYILAAASTVAAVVLVILGWMTWKSPVRAATNDGFVEIDSYDADLKLDDTGLLTVKETIRYDFDTEPSHGIYRSIPYRYLRNHLNDNLDIHLVSITDEQGNDWPVKKVKPGDFDQPASNVVWRIGSSAAQVTGRHTYIITYTARWIVERFSDHDELYWNVIGNYWDAPVRDSAVTIHLPADALDPNHDPQCYTGYYGSTDQNCFIKRVDTNVWEMRLDTEALPDGLDIGQGFTVLLAFKKGSIAEPSVMAAIWHFTKDNWSLFLLPFLLLLVIVLMVRARANRSTRPLIPMYEPSANVPAHLAEFLTRGKLSDRAFTSTLIQLAVDGYVHFIYDEKKKRVSQLKLMKPYAGTEPVALVITRKVFGSESLVTLKDKVIDRTALTSQLTTLDVAEAGRQGWYDLKLNSRQTWLGGLLGLLLVGGIILSIYGYGQLLNHLGVSGLVATAIGLVGILVKRRWRPLSVAGADVAKELEGFKWFLRVTEQERLKFTDAPRLTPQLFEKFLPYAVAFGVEKQWVGQFANILKEPPAWMEGAPMQYLFLSRALLATGHTFSGFKAPVRSSSYRGGGGGFSSGGGFSGGGFGGGGGGRW